MTDAATGRDAVDPRHAWMKEVRCAASYAPTEGQPKVRCTPPTAPATHPLRSPAAPPAPRSGRLPPAAPVRRASVPASCRHSPAARGSPTVRNADGRRGRRRYWGGSGWSGPGC
ncbi:hypothetical protein G6F57_017268 [Rhizopus arrhizus]|nr:hypothetical protein G6F65_015583 [Rhizopus arrhizus]KAG1446666.1 hypothetical protein G6F57_017268 [Rhizopus arrhizus]